MSRFIYIVLCIVTVSLNNITANEDRFIDMEKVTDIITKCAKMYGGTINDIQAAVQSTDVTLVNSCVWGCALKKAGFLNDKGQYALYPGLTYVRNIIKYDKAYSTVENIAKECDSVKYKTVSDGEAGCEMGALIIRCFMDKFEKRRSFG